MEIVQQETSFDNTSSRFDDISEALDNLEEGRP